MKTKAQKAQDIEAGAKELKASQVAIITDFSGLSANHMNILRKSLNAIGASMKVTKKRLLKFVFGKEGLDFEPKNFKGQVGVVFSPKDLSETASVVYQFLKGHKDQFKILGGYSVTEKQFMERTMVERIGQLPSREVLLGQLVYMLGAPIRSFLVVLNERAKKVESQ